MSYLTRDEEYQKVLSFVNTKTVFRMWEIQANTGLNYGSCIYYLRLLANIFYVEKAGHGKWRRLKNESKLGKYSEYSSDLHSHRPEWKDWFERDYFYGG